MKQDHTLIERSKNGVDREAHGRKFKRSQRADTVSDLLAAQALLSRKLKRELRGHLSFKMQWKIIYGTKFEHHLITQKSPMRYERPLRLAKGNKDRGEQEGRFPMLLRDHPLITYKGVHSWPPTWHWIDGRKNKHPRGEVGILREITLSNINPYNRCFLQIGYGQSTYLGCLLIEDHAFCNQIVKLLRDQIDRPIAEIGNLDISHLL